MKKEYFILFFCISCFVFSQQKQFNLKWEKLNTQKTERASINLPFFNEANYSFNFTNGLEFVSQWKTNEFINENSVNISNVNYALISKSELGELNLKTIPNKISYKLTNSLARGDNFAFLRVSPIIVNNGQYKKVTSFTITYKTSNARLKSNRNNNYSRTPTNSVLSSGEWRKFYVDTSGVFKVTKSFLQQIGVNTNVNPRTIKIYGNGGKMIPFSNAENQPYDVLENAIQVVGEEDNVFNDEDYILFYAEGPKELNHFTANGSEIISDTHINPYTDKTYYYITTGGGFGKRIATANQPVSNPDVLISTFHDYQFYEVDDFNIVKLGRRWFGNRFDIENEQIFNFNFPNLITTEPVSVKIISAAVSAVDTQMQIDINSLPVFTQNISATSQFFYANDNTYSNTFLSNSNDIEVKLSYQNNGNPNSMGYLDYISIEALRALRYEDNQFTFKNNDVATLNGTVQYTIENATNVTQVWDITDKYNITKINNANSDSSFNFKAQLGTLKKYSALDNSHFLTPFADSNTTVSNQNLKGTIFLNEQGVFQDIDYIILTPTSFKSQAERLANINRVNRNLHVKVVTLNEIYNEFSTSNQDVAALRNFVKYVYDNASVPENRLKYLCLFGDASFDYKDRLINNTNFCPSWFSYDSFNLTNSFVSDDFYGMMDANEGNMETSDKLDIAVGRILANNLQQAKELVDKVDNYYDAGSYRSWRNNFLLASDDVDRDWEGLIQEGTNATADLVTQTKPFINSIKVFEDAYVQQSSSGGERYPQAKEAFINSIEVGALVVNYFGHGGEDNLASERIFERIDAQNLGNICKLNCFVTVTCEFTKFDDPTRTTAGELTVWNKNGGAVSLLTTTRQIFVSFTTQFNREMNKSLFDLDNTGFNSISEELRITKNSSTLTNSAQKRLIFHMGDPALKLALPKPNINLTKINDVPISQTTDTLEALSTIKVSGEVTDESGVFLNNFNGIISTTIYDKPIQRETLANDGVTENGQLIKMQFETLGEIVFRGEATVTNGLFEFDFVVPRDISIPVGNGKMSFYARSNTTPIKDYAGSSTNFLIGGLNEDAPEDNIGPLINLYMNDESFISGAITNESPTLLAFVEDENGINTASGIGHDIVAILDNDETNPFVLNNYYETELDNYKKGTVNFPFRDLEPGLHTLSFKVWDVYNNSSTAEIQFLVFNENEVLVIDNVLNYPNPFVDYTEFWFNHNSSEPLDVSVQIFTVSGKLVRTLNGITNSNGIKDTSTLSRDIIWNGRDDFGDKIGKGVYVYKLTVRSNTFNKQVEKIEKLVIL